MRFTKNILSEDYKQLNGQRFTVEGITDDGQITINSNGKTQDTHGGTRQLKGSHSKG